MAFGNRLINTGSAAGQPLTIGDYVGGGIVFYVDPVDNTQGLVVSTVDVGSQRWDNENSGTLATTTAIGYGKYNTDLATAINPSGYAPATAKNYNGNGFNDWYLPSRDEMAEIRNNKTVVNAACISNGGSAFQEIYYHTSSQVNTLNIWVVHPTNGVAQGGSYNIRPLRAVRSYSPSDKLNIGQLVEEGIVMYTDPTWSTGGYTISVDQILGYTPVAYNMSYFTDTPKGVKDGALATDQIISQFSGSTSFPAGACRAYKDGKWDFPTRDQLNQFKYNTTTINNAIVAAGGSSVPADNHNTSSIWLAYGGGWGYTNPITGNGSITTTGYRIRATKYVGTWEIFRS